MRLIALLLSLCFSGCALFVDLSPEALHKDWIEYQQRFVGLGIYECQLGFCGKGKSSYSWGSSYLGEKGAGLGFQERGFRYGRFDEENLNRFPQCRFYFKYETSTGLITDFRYEESEPYACRFTGA